MTDHCCAPPPLKLDPHRGNNAYRRVLWAVLAINGIMFLVEIGAGLAAGFASLQADALDFLGDAANYSISLLVVGMALRYRATAAAVKGLTMGAFGLWIIGTVIWHALHGTLPSAVTMGAVGITALIANGHLSHCFGRTVRATLTCAPPGFARGTTFSGILPCCLLRSVCSAREPDGLTSSSPPLWLLLLCKVQPSVARHALAELRHGAAITA